MFTRFLLNLLIQKFIKGKNPSIRSLNHRYITCGKKQMHRVYAEPHKGRASGVGVSENIYHAQLMAIMEFLEREVYYSSPHAPTTSGMSAGLTKHVCKERAVLELLERDQALLSLYYNEELKEFPQNPEIKNIRFFYLTHDIPLHVVMAEMKTESGGRCFGFGSGFSWRHAYKKASLEAALNFDSRNVSVPEIITEKLCHVLPYLWPERFKSKFKLFEADSYRVTTLNVANLGDFSDELLWGALEKKGIHIKTDFFKKTLLPFLSVFVCRTTSDELQNLFFSGEKINISSKRCELLKYSTIPKNLILHPIP